MQSWEWNSGRGHAEQARHHHQTKSRDTFEDHHPVIETPAFFIPSSSGQIEGFRFAPIIANTFYFLYFDNSHPHGFTVYTVGFDLYLLLLFLRRMFSVLPWLSWN